MSQHSERLMPALDDNGEEKPQVSESTDQKWELPKVVGKEMQVSTRRH